MYKTGTGTLGRVCGGDLGPREEGSVEIKHEMQGRIAVDPPQMIYINNSLHLTRKYARIFVRGHYLYREANSFPRAKLEENCELRGTDNV